MTHQQNYQSRVLPNEGDPLATIPENHRVLARRVTRGIGDKYYRINIVQSIAPTPYPGNLDYRIERKVNADTKNKQSSQWQILKQGQIGQVAQKVFVAAASMLWEASPDSKLAKNLVDINGVQISSEFIAFYTTLRQFNSLNDWRRTLIDVIQNYQTLHPSQAIDYALSRAQTMERVLSLVGFSPVEVSYILQTYSVESGINLKRNYFIRFLKAAHPEQYKLLHYLQFYYHPASYEDQRDNLTNVIIKLEDFLFPRTLREKIVRPSGAFLWTLLDFLAVTTTAEDLRWDLLHGANIPDGVLSLYPDLALEFGFINS